MAPNDRSISPTTITSVSPSDMIATELIARSTEIATSTLKELGLRTKMTTATTMIATNRPPMRSATSKVACPAVASLVREMSAGTVGRLSALVIAVSANLEE